MLTFEPFQHYLYFIFDPWNWGTNASEQLIAFAVLFILGWFFKRYLWPKIHPLIRNWFKELHHEALEEHEHWKHEKGL